MLPYAVNNQEHVVNSSAAYCCNVFNLASNRWSILTGTSITRQKVDPCVGVTLVNVFLSKGGEKV